MDWIPLLLPEQLTERTTVKELKATLNNVLTCFSPISKSKAALMPNSTANIIF